jgi:hypothetical protein
MKLQVHEGTTSLGKLFLLISNRSTVGNVARVQHRQQEEYMIASLGLISTDTKVLIQKYTYSIFTSTNKSQCSEVYYPTVHGAVVLTKMFDRY